MIGAKMNLFNMAKDLKGMEKMMKPALDKFMKDSGFVKKEELTKLENRIKELLDTIEEVGGKVIIWCSYRHNIHKVIEALTKKYGQDCAEGFYGDTPSKERPKILKRFI